MKNISIIIPTAKNVILTKNSLSTCPVEYQLIVSTKLGLGHARNWGAKQAVNDLLLFLDDDLTLKKELWACVLNTHIGEFKMILNGYFPITRVMVIHKQDFWRVKGFDESYCYTSEDRDFYVRAIKNGLQFKPVPSDLIVHKPHVKRSRNIHVAIHASNENVRFILLYTSGFSKQIFLTDFLFRLKRMQARTLLIQVVQIYCSLFKTFSRLIFLLKKVRGV